MPLPWITWAACDRLIEEIRSGQVTTPQDAYRVREIIRTVSHAKRAYLYRELKEYCSHYAMQFLFDGEQYPGWKTAPYRYQVAAIRKLYRLDDPRPISERVRV